VTLFAKHQETTIHKATALAWIMHEMDRGYVATVAEMATETGMSKRTIQRWVNDLTAIYPLTQSDGYPPRYSRAERIRRTA
jgi:predicted DNA-binding transcriptional regulator YafY